MPPPAGLSSAVILLGATSNNSVILREATSNNPVVLRGATSNNPVILLGANSTNPVILRGAKRSRRIPRWHEVASPGSGSAGQRGSCDYAQDGGSLDGTAHAAGCGPGAPAMAERRRQIRALIDATGRVSSDELALRFNTSAVTIRSDLRALAASGALLRTHGGAVSHREGDEVPLAIRAGHHHPEKVRIAQAAASLVRDGDTILLDSGSTTHELAKQIAQRPLNHVNVITNALNVAMSLAHARHVHLVMLGGVLRENSFTLSGPQAESSLATLSADRLFLGVDSLDPERGLMTPHMMEAQLNAQMIRVARQVVAVADSSKLQRRNLSVIGALECLDLLITDVRAHPSVIDAIRDRGVDVMVV